MNYAEMTTDELRLEIAKRKNVHDIASAAEYGYSGNHDLYGMLTIGDRSSECWIPDWADDIAAAWELVEEMPNPCLEKLWLKDDKSEWRIWWNSDENFVDATTTPLAICRAWLAWKDSQDELL